MDGQREGLWRFYFVSSEQERMRGTYRRGQLHGLSQIFYHSGQIESQTEYRNGKRHGEHVEWHPDGWIRLRADYEDGELRKSTVLDAQGEVVATEPQDAAQPSAP